MIDMKEILTATKQLTVLYVEDSFDIREELVSIFEMFFKKIIVANDGKEGLELFKENTDIDFIVSDIKMPNMDGIEMASQIRKFDKDVPIVITTAFNDQGYFIKSIEFKIDRYILKPIDEDQMTQVFYDISKSIMEKKEYQKLKIEQEQRRLEEKAKDVVSKMTDAFVEPVVIFQGELLVFFSSTFGQLFQYKKIEISQNTQIDTIHFDTWDGCLETLS